MASSRSLHSSDIAHGGSPCSAPPRARYVVRPALCCCSLVLRHGARPRRPTFCLFVLAPVSTPSSRRYPAREFLLRTIVLAGLLFQLAPFASRPSSNPWRSAPTLHGPGRQHRVRGRRPDNRHSLLGHGNGPPRPCFRLPALPWSPAPPRICHVHCRSSISYLPWTSPRRPITAARHGTLVLVVDSRLSPTFVSPCLSVIKD
ncbi:uncharacterized protein [Zea mays]|jgi:hypothetical protein|uniref:uncharacterized protein n=1 Tax=Zea mays TaxID=4577 RepID=UPI0009AADC06|nr:uncharacterized protein LOC109942275 [Zea mays]|eukprot:XP_020399746.1 uncharacterized protein LOC109942275 [Zea mays]